MAAEHFKGLRNSIVDGNCQLNELSLGVPWAVVQQLWQLKGGGLGKRVGPGEAHTTAVGQRVFAEHHLQKCSNNTHGSFI